MSSREGLEKLFFASKETAELKIRAKVQEAKECLQEAQKVSEEFGIPFRAGVSPLSNTYYPKSFNLKWNELVEQMKEDPDIQEDWCEVLDIPSYGYYGSFEGWEHSAAC